MLKVECESCKAPYQVDERRVPQTGLKMRCPKCGHTFLVTDPSKGAARSSSNPEKPGEGLNLRQTMVGVGLSGAPPPRKPPPVPARSAAVDSDLPAIAFDAALPSVLGRSPAAPKPPPAPAVAPPAPFNFDMHRLDSVELPSPKRAAFEDLPSPHRGAELPAAKGGGDLPAAKGDGFGFDLPIPKAGGFADLPVPQGHLPRVSGHHDLPVVGGGNLPRLSSLHDLPVVGGGNLPRVSGPHDLPVVGGNLPTVGGAGLPARSTGTFGEIDLPSIQNELPQPMDLHAQMPMAVPDERLAPSRPGARPPSMGFGELDLPLVGAADRSSSSGPGIASFGELDLPPDSSLPPAPMSIGHGHGGPASYGPSSGGLGFGEVDLGGSADSAAPSMGPPPVVSGGSMFHEASLESTRQVAPSSARTRERDGAGHRPSSKAPKVIVATVAILIAGGTALQFTPVGAFGHIAISDKLHAGDYTRDALAAADAARAKLALDTFASAQQAADDLAELKRRSPRSRALASYAAFAEYVNQLRFGRDSTRGARAKTFLSDIPPGADVSYFRAALAAQSANVGELSAAKSALAAAREPKDGIQYDLAVLRGEIALTERDGAGALQAFTEAAKMAPNARSQFGLARAHYAMKNFAKAKAAADATLALSPTHAGAHTLSAVLAWELRRDDAGALKELDAVLDDKARKSAAPGEVSSALAAKGWITLALERAGDARAAFDEAVKLDPRNVSALVGQGEVLYADGRYTEALTRFDEAVLKDPTGLAPLIGAAKTKIVLERLADAKAQLTAARARAPREMSVARWLAKAEEALGNKSAAEKLYVEAVELADSANPDAIQAYSALASFLASQGRAAEAQKRLEEARAKLPDSATLQRAFGDVAATQGHFDVAIGHYQSALERNGNDLGTRFRLGVAFRNVKRLEEAAKEFDTIVATDKDFPNIAVERGLLFEQSGDVTKALEQFQTALEKTPKDIDLQLRVGAAYVAIGEVDKALPLLTKVKEQRPNSAEANHFIGRAHLRRGGRDAVTAMRYLQRAVELDPNRAEYHLYVAWAANESVPAQLGLARTEVDKALSLDRLLADAYWQRGIVSLRESAVNDAVKDLKHALDLKPTRYEAHASLAEAFEQKNDTAAAMGEWSRAIAGDDKVPMWRYRLGRSLLEKGNAAEAARHLAFAVDAGKKAEPRPGWLGRAAFEAGEALRKTGQKAQAIEAYQLYFDLAPPSDPDRRDAAQGLQQVGGTRER